MTVTTEELTALCQRAVVPTDGTGTDREPCDYADTDQQASEEREAQR